MEEKILDILESICGVDEVKEDKDLDLFDSGLLDSLATIELLIALEEKLGVKIEPTEVQREDINTPNKIIEYVSLR
ncbi:D-alanine--poly(phosphoribitol) ligase subunit DltC [Clostridium aciditolerans]|uniref:D-alanyl carrier protein n=1 Tax=Clostridium aciditolerans TaxID=339861 RepID=A0A934HR76_9CLOT|nr:D-alanine--poly(phosphoribitol) ligase subunit DltC [Clostridium aciditolerans]MBI6872991.1 D-alanine--poly(phosphoribitol) ligase subunit DltC [Clostridium aciditolerans]